MSNKLPLAVALLAVSTASAWVAACSSNNSTNSNADSGASNGGSGSGGSSSGSGGGSGSSGGAVHDSGVSVSPHGDAGRLGLLVDNMTATRGTQLSLMVPAGDTAGSYYTYSDVSVPVTNYLLMRSLVTGTSQLVDTPVSPAVTNADGSQIVGELCFGGEVVSYAGLGMSLAYGTPGDAEAGALSSPVPFDASHYSGVSFYIKVDPTDGPAPSIHFGVPDTQTADPAAWAMTACNAGDAAPGSCDDDFGSDLTFTPGMWTKVTLAWADLQQQTWGAQFPLIKQNQLIGMKWQANGPGADAAATSFNFCVSDIYFTP
jgi:hypothetical protein